MAGVQFFGARASPKGRIKGARVSSTQALKVLFPRGRYPDVAAAAVSPVVADVQTIVAEVADDDTVAVRIDTGSPDVHSTEEVHAPYLVVCGDGVAHFGCVRDLLHILQQHRLLSPVLAAGVWARLLADCEPFARFDHDLAGELVALVCIPALRLGVEQLVVEVTNLKQVHFGRRGRHEHVAVCTEPYQRLEVGKGLGEVLHLLIAVGPAVCRYHIFGRQEVITEDEMGKVSAFRQLQGSDLAVTVDLRAAHFEIGDQIATLCDVLHRSREVGTRLQHDAEKLCSGVEGRSVKVCDVGHRVPPFELKLCPLG